MAHVPHAPKRPPGAVCLLAWPLRRPLAPPAAPRLHTPNSRLPSRHRRRSTAAAASHAASAAARRRPSERPERARARPPPATQAAKPPPQPPPTLWPSSLLLLPPFQPPAAGAHAASSLLAAPAALAAALAAATGVRAVSGGLHRGHTVEGRNDAQMAVRQVRRVEMDAGGWQGLGWWLAAAGPGKAACRHASAAAGRVRGRTYLHAKVHGRGPEVL